MKAAILSLVLLGGMVSNAQTPAPVLDGQKAQVETKRPDDVVQGEKKSGDKKKLKVKREARVKAGLQPKKDQPVKAN